MPWRRRRRRHAVAKTSWHVSSMTDCMRCPVECPLACDTFFFIVAAGFYRLNVLSQLSQIKKGEETFSPEGQSRHLMSPNLILLCYPDVIIRLFGGCSLGVSAFSTIGDISLYGACTLHSPPPQQAGAPLCARTSPAHNPDERKRERERGLPFVDWHTPATPTEWSFVWGRRRRQCGGPRKAQSGGISTRSRS